MTNIEVDDLLEEEDPLKQIVYQAVIEQGLKTYEQINKNLATMIANNMARLNRR